MDSESKIEMILEWATENENFDTSFVEDLKDKLEEFGSLTLGQENALDNIIEKWGIE